MKLGRSVLQVNTHRLTESISDVTSYFQDGDHDVISRRKVLPSDECTAHTTLAVAYAAASASSCSIVHSYFYNIAKIRR